MSPSKYIIINFPKNEFINGQPQDIYGVNYRQNNCPPESARSHEYLNNAIALGAQYQTTHPNILIAEVSWRVTRPHNIRTQKMYITGLISMQGETIAQNLEYNVHTLEDRKKNANAIYNLIKSHIRATKNKKKKLW